jgi:hypothetical protein
LGGAPELAGSSPTTTVSVVQFGPLTPGVTYEFWLVGDTQSAGEGPQSNHVTHVGAGGAIGQWSSRMALRQEVLNVLLAELLQERGLVAVPEQVLKHPTESVQSSRRDR